MSYLIVILSTQNTTKLILWSDGENDTLRIQQPFSKFVSGKWKEGWKWSGISLLVIMGITRAIWASHLKRKLRIMNDDHAE